MRFFDITREEDGTVERYSAAECLRYFGAARWYAVQAGVDPDYRASECEPETATVDAPDVR
jgi:hypothetical protein